MHCAKMSSFSNCLFRRYLQDGQLTGSEIDGSLLACNADEDIMRYKYTPMHSSSSQRSASQLSTDSLSSLGSSGLPSPNLPSTPRLPSLPPSGSSSSLAREEQQQHHQPQPQQQQQQQQGTCVAETTTSFMARGDSLGKYVREVEDREPEMEIGK